jgi:hypothetical protein
VADEELLGERYVFGGPLTKRMTAEQFVDAVWQVTEAGPDKMDAPIISGGVQPGAPRAAAAPLDGEPKFIRASLVKSDLLMRSLGRPNREQVVTTRPTLLTTLEAIDLANGTILNETLQRGAKKIQARFTGEADVLIEWLFLSSLSRKPTAGERRVARRLAGRRPSQQNVEDLLWAVFMLPEFQLIR